MEDLNAFRGYDLLIQKGKVYVHLVHHWPENVLKIASRESLPSEVWTHVFVTSDGSGKAAGLRLYLDGYPVEFEVQNDTLSGTIATSQPLRLGRRATMEYLNGDLADVRFYRRTLSPGEVREIAAAPALAIARIAVDRQSKTQREQLRRYFREHVDHDLRVAERQLGELKRKKAERESRIPTVMVMEDLPAPRPTFVLKRGRYDVPDSTQRVDPGVPKSLGVLPARAPANRLGLASWLVSPDNPLTARVAVNRLWQQHFGTGLVKTAENFGLQSEPPSHLELLDWLATEFVRSGWDQKALHRLIVTSATYRQSSKASPDLIHRDPENRVFGRGPRFRLSAELVRDNALAIAGLLTQNLGGPSVKPYQPAGLWEELAGGAGEGPYVQDRGPNLYRRSLYVYRKRTVPHPAMATFDAPSREICQVRRARTNTPLQALELLNDATYVEAAAQLARLTLTMGGQSPEDRLTFAFRRATARRPSPAELNVILRGLERYHQSFRSDPQSTAQWIRQGKDAAPAGFDPTELAAYSAAASVILNLDETITLE
jgi:hypothetical protein